MEMQKSEVICTVYTVHNREAGLKLLKISILQRHPGTPNLFYGLGAKWTWRAEGRSFEPGCL